jgi:hypothetical protein
MRELIIEFVIQALVPVLETTVTGNLYYDDIPGHKFTWSKLLTELYLECYRIMRELIRIESPHVGVLVSVL